MYKPGYPRWTQQVRAAMILWLTHKVLGRHLHHAWHKARLRLTFTLMWSKMSSHFEASRSYNVNLTIQGTSYVINVLTWCDRKGYFTSASVDHSKALHSFNVSHTVLVLHSYVVGNKHLVEHCYRFFSCWLPVYLLPWYAVCCNLRPATQTSWHPQFYVLPYVPIAPSAPNSGYILKCTNFMSDLESTRKVIHDIYHDSRIRLSLSIPGGSQRARTGLPLIWNSIPNPYLQLLHSIPTTWDSTSWAGSNEIASHEVGFVEQIFEDSIQTLLFVFLTIRDPSSPWLPLCSSWWSLPLFMRRESFTGMQLRRIMTPARKVEFLTGTGWKPLSFSGLELNLSKTWSSTQRNSVWEDSQGKLRHFFALHTQDGVQNPHQESGSYHKVGG